MNGDSIKVVWEIMQFYSAEIYSRDVLINSSKLQCRKRNAEIIHQSISSSAIVVIKKEFKLWLISYYLRFDQYFPHLMFAN